MGWSLEPLCTGRPCHTELSPNPPPCKKLHGRGTETLPSHITKLQQLREACRGLGMDIADTQFTGVITLSMPMPSWDPVIGPLGGVLDLKVVITCLCTEWSQRQGLASASKDSNIV